MQPLGTASTRWMLLAASYSVWFTVILWVVLSLGGLGTKASRLFNWHPVLASGAVLGALTPGVLVSTARNSDDAKRSSRTRLLHALCVLLAFVVLTIAVSVVYTNRLQRKQPNFYSLHSWLGLASLLLMKGNIVAGIASLLFPRFRTGSFGTTHRYAGMFICFSSFLCAVLGFAQMQQSLSRNSGTVWHGKVVLAGLLGAATLCIGTAVVLLLLNGEHCRRSSNEDECELKREGDDIAIGA